MFNSPNIGRLQAAFNGDASDCPAFGLCAVSASDTGATGQFTFLQPTSDGQQVWLNGPVPIQVGNYGSLTNDFPAWAYYNPADGTPAIGELWGAGAGSWQLRKGKAGFRICGTPDTTLNIVQVERVVVIGRTPFVSALTSTSSPDSWQSKTLSSGSWVNDTPIGTTDAYPVLVGGSPFAPVSGSQSIMWEEPPGSGIYAFMPIQFASNAAAGFVSTVAQVFLGNKTFLNNVEVDGSFYAASGAKVSGIFTLLDAAGSSSVLFAENLTTVPGVSLTYSVEIGGLNFQLGYGFDGVHSNLCVGNLSGCSGSFVDSLGRTFTFTGGILTSIV